MTGHYPTQNAKPDDNLKANWVLKCDLKCKIEWIERAFNIQNAKHKANETAVWRAKHASKCKIQGKLTGHLSTKYWINQHAFCVKWSLRGKLQGKIKCKTASNKCYYVWRENIAPTKMQLIDRLKCKINPLKMAIKMQNWMTKWEDKMQIERQNAKQKWKNECIKCIYNMHKNLALQDLKEWSIR